MTLKALPYVYKITNIHTNQFYIGSRCNKSAKHHSQDFGIKYFTSSNYVKELGFENFKTDWIEEFPTKELAYDWEQMMIHVNLKDPLCLNKFSTFKNKKRWSTAGVKIINSHRTGKKLSQETKDKISIGNKNKIISEETKLKMSNSRIGLKHSKETKLKQSISKLGELNPNFGKKPWHYGIKIPEKYKITCIYCNLKFTKPMYSRWHGNKCKKKI